MQVDYSSGSPTAARSSAQAAQPAEYWGLDRLKRAYNDYLGNKREEIDEAKDARRYYHGAQWTAEQLRILRARKQPVTTLNRIGRKIDGVVGLLERLRQDPKAYPRTPKHEDGADLATAIIRYVLDEGNWKAKSAEVARDGAIEGIAGIEILLTEGDRGDQEVSFELVEPDSFFYDPRSYRADFSDARYMGIGKWVDVELAKEMFPDKAEEIDASIETGTDFTSNPDRENKWFDSANKHIRLVDCWYRHKGEWCWSIFTGSTRLMEGDSYLRDEKNKTECKYVMYSANVDHDGDRYGFVRNMRPIQDSINFKESKVNFTLGSRRLIMDVGAVEDIEEVRREWARPDGVVMKNRDSEVIADDRTFDFAGWTKLLADAKTEIENFGPNPAVLGEGVEKSSGRAIQLLQQAGIAELGPYIQAYKGWKLRVYRAVFNAVQRGWTAERHVRVTDDEGLAQFIQINGVGIDPMTGFPTMVNAIGSLDVDIIIDEGPDAINMMADTYDAMLALAQNGAQVPPAVLIELNPGIDSRTKKKVLGMLEKASQPGPEQQIAIEGAMAEVGETKSRTALNMAKAEQAARPEIGQPQRPEKFELPPEVQVATAIADIENTNADTQAKRSQAYKTEMDASLAPQQAAHQQRMDAANFQQGARDRAEDRMMAARRTTAA